MNLLRQEIRNFAHHCEQLLSNHLPSPLTEQEQELVVYYLNELRLKFAQPDSVDTPNRRAERRRQLYTKDLQLEQGILNAVMIGEFELTAAEIEFLKLLHEAARKGATKVLVDGQQMTGNPEDFERFLYGAFVAWAALEVMREHRIKLRFAYVINDPVRDPEQYGETVA